MKFGFSLAVVLSLLVNPSVAQNTSLFGLENPELARFFLEEAMDIVRSGSGTRNPFANSNASREGLSEFEVLQEAYRSDPEATLDLIDRILNAGRKQ